MELQVDYRRGKLYIGDFYCELPDGYRLISEIDGDTVDEVVLASSDERLLIEIRTYREISPKGMHETMHNGLPVYQAEYKQGREWVLKTVFPLKENPEGGLLVEMRTTEAQGRLLLEEKENRLFWSSFCRWQ